MLTWNLSGDGILTLRTDPSIPANADFIHNGVLERTGPWSSVGNVVITTGNATDTVNVNDSVANVPVTVNLGSGSDTVNVTPTSQFLDHIQGNLTLNGGIGFDTLNVFDPIDGGNDTYTMTSSSVMRNRSVPINYGSFTDVFIYGGFGNETYNVNGTSSAPDTGLITGSGSDTVNVRGTTRPLDVLGHGNDVVNARATPRWADCRGSASPRLPGTTSTPARRGWNSTSAAARPPSMSWAPACPPSSSTAARPPSTSARAAWPVSRAR